MKKLFALILAVLMLAGCQLASEEIQEAPMNDRLVGVFITMDHMDLDFDIEGWLNDNGISGDAEIDMAEGLAYQEKLPVTIGDNGWVVPGHEGLSIGRYWNGEYWTGFSSEGICELNSSIAAGDDGDTIEVEGTVCFPMDSEVMLCANPVYQTPEGEFYVVQGNSFQSQLEYGPMSHGIQDEKTWTENGVSRTFRAHFTTTARGVELAERVVLVWMDADYRELSRVEYAVEELPESVTPAEDANFLIIQEHVGGSFNSKFYQREDEQLSIFYQSEHPWCLPKFVTIEWSE